MGWLNQNAKRKGKSIKSRILVIMLWYQVMNRQEKVTVNRAVTADQADNAHR